MGELHAQRLLRENNHNKADIASLCLSDLGVNPPTYNVCTENILKH
jgi:hypothetical protein